MARTSAQGIATRGLSILRGVGAWMAIRPEQTYVATSIPGLGACKSTYCRAERRQTAAPAGGGSGRVAGRLLVAAMVGVLSGCAACRPLADVTNPGDCGRRLVDCQKFAVPVSPGAAAPRASGEAGIRLATAAAAGRSVPRLPQVRKGEDASGRSSPSAPG